VKVGGGKEGSFAVSGVSTVEGKGGGGGYDFWFIGLKMGEGRAELLHRFGG